MAMPFFRAIVLYAEMLTMFDLPYRIGRYSYSTDEDYAGRLSAVTRRPIENSDPKVLLLRLEFEIFLIDEFSRVLRDTQGVASRDLVLTSKAKQDKAICRYGTSLGVNDPRELKCWKVLERRRPWIKLRFAERDQRDFRQPFEQIEKFDCKGYEIDAKSGRHSVASTYVPAKLIQETMKRSGTAEPPSIDKINRKAEEFEKHFPDVVQKTAGGQRRFHLKLFLQLWNNPE